MITGKVAIITGASRGIGYFIAKMFANVGAKVVLVSRKQDSLNKVANEIKESGGEAIPIAAHVGDQNAINSLIDNVKTSFGGVDILVNNAGTNPHFGPILTAEESQWDKIFDINLKGYFRMTKSVAGIMKERGGGKIINMASIAGLHPSPGMGVYCISKAGVIMLTKVLAVELAKDNIQVNAIAPGFIKTQFSSAFWNDESMEQSLNKEIPAKRLGLPEELAELALYLASPASNYITGSVFVADGGLMIGGFTEYYNMLS